MIGISVVTGRYPGRRRADLMRYAAIGLIGGTLPQLTLFWIAENVPAMVISIVLSVESFIVFVFAAAIGLEAPNLKRFIGLSLGMASVLLVMLPGAEASGGGNWLWILAAILVPFYYAVESLMIAAMPATDDDAVGTTTGIVVASALIVMPLTIFSGSFIPVDEVIGGYGWVFLLVAALSCASMILLIFAIRSTGAVFASQVGYATTVGGIIWSIILLDEQMTGWMLAAVACLISGVALVMPKSYDVDDESAASDQSSSVLGAAQ
jgi:drug/metabolite transporter (DMT)-like permease